MQGRKLFVGNLSHCVTAAEETEQLRELFSNYGDVEEVNIVKMDLWKCLADPRPKKPKKN